MRVVREVRQAISSLASGSSPGVVAVSGGADSIALLRALHAVHLDSLTVAHVNHQLRGAESDADEAFVRDLSASLGLPFRMARLDVAEQAARANLEETARLLRYAFFSEVALEAGASWVATGHTADDQAETVLNRVIRGTGLQGLRGIHSIRPLGDGQVQIIRPLLTVTRTDVIAYLASLNQLFREDSSNTDPRFTRNRLRHELLPLLKTFNPDVVSALAELAAQAGDAFEVLEADARRLLVEVELPRAGEAVILNAMKLERVHPYRARELLRHLWLREDWPMSDMNADHWTRLVSIAKGQLAAADFPDGIRARRLGRVLQIGRQVK